MAMARSTILIADDEACITFMLGERLTDLGMNVLTASDGEEALSLATKHVPSAIVTDYQMPRMDGLELARRLRNTPATAEIPVIMLTARGHRLSPTELRSTNIQQLMAKPFSARELVALLEEVIISSGRSNPLSHPREAA